MNIIFFSLGKFYIFVKLNYWIGEGNRVNISFYLYFYLGYFCLMFGLLGNLYFLILDIWK